MRRMGALPILFAATGRLPRQLFSVLADWETRGYPTLVDRMAAKDSLRLDGYGMVRKITGVRYPFNYERESHRDPARGR